ncbi:MAG: Gfo/Idh/MocA family oxidoreductase, partial [Desulfobacterales bacterium]|nr:Gfo/Idh/MocA family oxidoreductase [Desulfobacterales bacterium]
MSCSYGPGRYDLDYEEKGIDYPIGYVRWTEKRNMEEFLRLIQQGRLKIEPLVSHEFELKDAAEAYDLLIKQPDDCLAILLKYSTEPEEIKRTVSIKPGKKVHKKSDRSSVAIVGCGAFARQFHLPNIKANKHLDIRTLCASSGQSAKEMGERYGAEICTTDTDEIIEDPAVDSVMIFTRDTLHAGVVTAALKSGKHVFCEKPLATTLEECKGIMAAQKEKESVCFIGFNRRFAPLMQQAKKIVEKCAGPKMIHYRVNAGPLPNNSWIYDPAYSAGRVIGEICHFIDLMAWLVGKEPVSVIAQTAGSPKETVRTENVNALFRFEDGSTGSILYTAEGVSSFPKERMEIFSSGTAIAMDDYQKLTVRGAERIDETNRNGDKGHGEEIIRFTEAVLGREAPAISHIDGIRATICCLKILESIKDNEM